MKKDVFPVAIIGGLAAIPVILIMALHHPKPAGTDPLCMNNCTQRGFETRYCETRCSFDPALQAQNGGDPDDPRCLNSCRSAGRDPAFCEKTCRYY
ncbi:MAG: hypothetical protein KGL10_00075 [Alphaproteobacteria bacterium]|nr:hypothetical protein [Alphaproteobacteria bacterium]